MFGQDRLEKTELYAQEKEQEISDVASELERLAKVLRSTGSFEFLKEDGTKVEATSASRLEMKSEYVQHRSSDIVRLIFSWENTDKF